MGLFSKNWCNLIFEQRNKEYGAYLIRKESGRRHLLATSIVVVGTSAISFLPLLVELGLKGQKKEPVINIAELAKLEGTMVKEANVEKRKQKTESNSDEEGDSDKKRIKATPANLPSEWIGELSNISSDPNNTAAELGEDEEAKVHDADSVGVDVAKSTEQTAGKIVEEMPLFPGGIAALMKWLEKTINYPAYCQRGKIEGLVKVGFIVEADGTVKDPILLKRANRYLDAEALNIVKKMPKWQPGKKNGKATKVRITLPIEFKLE